MALPGGMDYSHWGSRALSRTGTGFSWPMRKVYFLCNRVPCGHSWGATLEDIRTISLSGLPDSSVDLPVMRRSEVGHVFDVLSQ